MGKSIVEFPVRKIDGFYFVFFALKIDKLLHVCQIKKQTSPFVKNFIHFYC